MGGAWGTRGPSHRDPPSLPWDADTRLWVFPTCALGGKSCPHGGFSVVVRRRFSTGRGLRTAQKGYRTESTQRARRCASEGPDFRCRGKTTASTRVERTRRSRRRIDGGTRRGVVAALSAREDRVHEDLGVEGCQVVGALPQADEFDG